MPPLPRQGLIEKVRDLRDHELFYIVLHRLKRVHLFKDRKAL